MQKKQLILAQYLHDAVKYFAPSGMVLDACNFNIWKAKVEKLLLLAWATLRIQEQLELHSMKLSPETKTKIILFNQDQWHNLAGVSALHNYWSKQLGIFTEPQFVDKGILNVNEFMVNNLSGLSH